VRRKGDGVNQGRLTGPQTLDFLARLHLPDARGAIVARCGRQPALGGGGQTVEQARVSLTAVQQPAVRGIEYQDVPLIGGQDAAAVGGEAGAAAPVGYLPE